MSASNPEKTGIVISGVDQERPVYFYVTVGVDFSTYSLSFITATGAPDNDEFSSIDPATNPQLLRKTIVDVKFELKKDNKQFYTDTVEQEFERIITNNFDMLSDLVEGDSKSEEFENFFSYRIREFRASEINIEIVDFEDLQFEGDDEEENTEDPETDNFELESDKTVQKVKPVIDVNDGKGVESLNRGQKVLVKPANENREEKDQQDNQMVGTFLEFSPDESEGEGSMLVQLDEDVCGIATVSTGSLLKLYKEGHGDNILEQYLQSFLKILLGVGGILILILALVYAMT